MRLHTAKAVGSIPTAPTTLYPLFPSKIPLSEGADYYVVRSE